MNPVNFSDLRHWLANRIKAFFTLPVYFGRFPQTLQGQCLVFFPLHTALFCCGLAGIVSYAKKEKDKQAPDGEQIVPLVAQVRENDYAACIKNNRIMEKTYLGGESVIDALAAAARSLKTDDAFYAIYVNEGFQKILLTQGSLLSNLISAESKTLAGQMGVAGSGPGRIMVQRLEALKDISWCLKAETLDNIHKIRDLQSLFPQKPDKARTLIFKKINTVLNSIDRLEVRGRDSAGISLMFWMKSGDFKRFENRLIDPDCRDLFDNYQKRIKDDVLLNQSIRISEVNRQGGESLTGIALVYKFASEVGRLGDNISYLRRQIQSDPVLQILAGYPMDCDLVSAHTRWASVGAINECNCHPLDSHGINSRQTASGIIHVCLNGDIDNYLELKHELERSGRLIQEDVTTDTKIIPLLIEKHLCEGHDVAEAFRKTVNLFDGSHAITMHTDREPGKLFLAQKGSGQALFVGLAKDFYLTSSEVYGFVEETSDYWKMAGEKVVEGRKGKTQGQIAVLDQSGPGRISDILVRHYDNTPVLLTEKDIQHTRITSRDIDRQGFAHYFLKEISEAPASVEKTLENRWKIKTGRDSRYGIALDEETVPARIQQALKAGDIRRIFFVGQGTAGVAAKVCANLFTAYLNTPDLLVGASKASEFSGFMISDTDDHTTFRNTLVIAVSQSGTTADTNRTVDMVKKRGAYTLAIVNRRDSDITYKVDGVMYTSSGRDIEMSVASTKAFYSQIVAGAVLGLFVASLTGARNDAFVGNEIKNLLALPEKMRRVLANRDKIRESANRTASAKTYWAVVGSGPNKAAADEIRIKLSELCYKTISTDYVEDKKHIDLSSEPLIIVCAAGARPKVAGDIVKDCAIFQAHKAVPIVIADEGEHRFDPYAVDVFHVPPLPEHLSPVLNTLAGHLWGYYAALAINEGSVFLYGFREDVRRFLDEQSEKGYDVYEVILDKGFREKIAAFYYEFRRQKALSRLPAVMEPGAVSDLTLLLKYLSGRLPASDFELDFGAKGTAMNMLNALFECLGAFINALSRPVDAIKHQAKTVTVGTSRISEKVEGLLFDGLKLHDIGVSRLTNSNVMVLKNLQEVVGTVNGTILYKIDGLDLLGEPTDRAAISVIEKTGILQSIPSRVETDTGLKGTKRIIVRQGNVYIGKGRKDDRSIVVIPIISSDPDLPNRIEHLLLFNISFKEKVSIQTKVKALGGKYEHIKNIVQENSLIWKDDYLDIPEIGELFGRSAEKIAEFIASRV